VALLGPPGSGKGTQAAALERHLGIPVVSTGQLIRDQAGAGGAWHRLASLLDKGELVPDDVALAAVNDFLHSADTSKGYALDGFPRTVGQARSSEAPPVDLAIHLEVPDEVARERLVQRQAAGRSDDADQAAIERRLRRYHAETEPLLDLFRQRGNLLSIDGTQPADAVTEAIFRAIGWRG
jgi:adenylate kinase